MAKLPSTRDVAAKLYTYLHNAGPGSTMPVSDPELVELGERKHGRMAYKVGVESELRSLGCEVNNIDGQRTLRIPSESNMVSLREAIDINREAQETGVRTSPSCTDNNVIMEK